MGSFNNTWHVPTSSRAYSASLNSVDGKCTLLPCTQQLCRNLSMVSITQRALSTRSKNSSLSSRTHLANASAWLNQSSVLRGVHKLTGAVANDLSIMCLALGNNQHISRTQEYLHLTSVACAQTCLLFSAAAK